MEVFAFFGCVLGAIDDWVRNSEGWAAWVQAIGTIIALGIAIAIPYFEHRKQRQAEINKEKLRLNVLASLFQHIQGLFHDAKAFIDNCRDQDQGHEFEKKREEADKLTTVAESLLQRLKQVPLSEMPDAAQIYFVIEIEHGLGKFKNYLFEGDQLGLCKKTDIVSKEIKFLIKEIDNKQIAADALKNIYTKAMRNL